jgi:hypothetical protein
VRTGSAAFFAVLLLAPFLAGAGTARAEGESGAPDLILRKSFSRPAKRAGALPASPQLPGAAAAPPASAPGGAGAEQRTAAVERRTEAITRVATLLGERLVVEGTLYLRDGRGPGMALDNGRTPLVDLGSGRQVILAAGAEVPADEIRARWPGLGVVSLASGDLRETLGAFLAAAGYAMVLRDTPVAIGREAVVRFRPDFVVQKEGDALLPADTYLLFVLPSPGEALPAELREAAREHRLELGEVFESGEPPPAPSPWRDPRAPLTTVRARHPGVLVGEVAEALGIAVERKVPCLAALGEGAPEVVADLRIARGTKRSLVFFHEIDADAARRLAEAGEDVLIAAPGAPADAIVARVLERFGIPRIGPTVQFHRPGPAGRFTIDAPGWLADREGGGRVLITPASLGTQLRLYLTREGIGVFEYACP